LLVAPPGGSGAAQSCAPDGPSAAPPTAPVERLSMHFVNIVNDADKDTAARARSIAKALRAALDLDTLAGFVMGRYTGELDAAAQATFRRAFSDYLVTTYARVLARTALAEMTVVACRRVTPETAAVASRVVRPQGPEDRWTWRLHRTDGGRWAIVDLQTPAASLAVNYRSAFADLIDRRGFDGLIHRLRTHTGREVILPAENRAILMLIRGMRADRLALTAQ
jgi:ABC-type transporter MlaC component